GRLAVGVGHVLEDPERHAGEVPADRLRLAQRAIDAALYLDTAEAVAIAVGHRGDQVVRRRGLKTQPDRGRAPDGADPRVGEARRQVARRRPRAEVVEGA